MNCNTENYDYLLERMTFPDTIVLDKLCCMVNDEEIVQKQILQSFNDYFQYTCGRGKDNKILCKSIEVSRNHCYFMRTTDGLAVCDLQSLNGIYLNGERIEPHTIVRLIENDKVGIGCPDLDVQEECKFVYTIKISQTMTSEPMQFDVSSSSSSDRRVDRKRSCQANEDSKVPDKIIKIEEVVLSDSSMEFEGNENIPLEKNAKSIFSHVCKSSEPASHSDSNILRENNQGNNKLEKEEVPEESPMTDNDINHDVSPEDKNGFSQTDVVDLSNEEGDLFPYSQLFDDAPKTEIVKQENEEEHYVKPYDGDEVITVSDSENEQDEMWLQKLSRSQLMIDDEENIAKTEIPAEVISEMIENDAFEAKEIPLNEIDNVSYETEDLYKARENDEFSSSSEDLFGPKKSSGEENQNIPHETEDTNSYDSIAEELEKLQGEIPVALRKKAITEKRAIPIIDAPHFGPRLKRPLKVSPTAPSSSKSKKKNKAVKENEVVQCKTKYQSKESKYLKTVLKRKKGSRAKNDQTIVLSRKERREIKHDRKEKLKTLASGQKSNTDNDLPQKRIIKPVAKVTTKTRSDLLIDEQLTTKNQNKLKPHHKKHEKIDKLPLKKIPKIIAKSTDKTILNNNNDPQPSNLNKSILRVKEEMKKYKIPMKSLKRVSFNDSLQTVREYQIEDSNTLKRVVGKDVPINFKKPVEKEVNKLIQVQPKLEEFLFRIFHWNPVWLQEQTRAKEMAPVVKSNELIPILTRYQSFDDYYKSFLPSVLLEIWSGITKDFESIDKGRPTVTCSVIENTIKTTQIMSTNLYLTTLMVEVLVDRESFNKLAHPAFGDLVFFEFVELLKGKQVFRKKFAYVKELHQTIITPSTYYNQELNNFVKNPYALLTYTILTRCLEGNFVMNRAHRLRTVTYLRANMRLIQSIQYLPLSPLKNLILQPKVDTYRLPPLNTENCSLLTKDDLNVKQTDAVFRVTRAVFEEEPKICLIHGPPGTGKSKVIVNIVAQIINDNRNRRSDQTKKILLCAPSNAAIDELVLRLLALRSCFEKNRLKMVRVGRPEMMNPKVKDISLKELAKRDIRKSTNHSSIKNSESVEHEKKYLEARINTLKNEMAPDKSLDEYHSHHVKTKLANLKAKYDLLKTPVNLINPKELSKLQKDAEQRLLLGADIIACTLSSCYTNLMETIFGEGSSKKMSVCIVDEASQTMEPETLIPLLLGVETLVLVGDPNQLPATILSQKAKQLGLGQSLFSRIKHSFNGEVNSPLMMLDMQYRMAYPISYWPNKYFYKGKLKNSARDIMDFPFHSYRVLNLKNTNQNHDKFSNQLEAKFVGNLIFTMMTCGKIEEFKSISIGILTPYNNQRSLMTKLIDERIKDVPDNIKKIINMEVNTVDGFQGQERDIIIMSCVRTQGIGFLSDKQRLCVALTRAKQCLILCGNFKTFVKDEMWNALIKDARGRGIHCYIDANATPQEIKPHIIKSN